MTYAYDDFDRITRITYPDGTFEQLNYDRLDLKAVRDRLARTTNYEYNALGQLIKVTDPLNRVMQLTWCRCGDIRSLVDPMGRETHWEHDIQGRVTAKTYVDGASVRYFYEEDSGNLSQRVDEKGQSTLYGYYLDDALRSITYPDALVEHAGCDLFV